MNCYLDLKQKLERGDALIGVLGLGYVGLPLCHALHEGGLSVLGFDIDPEKIEALDAGRSYLKHFGEERTAALARSPRFSSTTDFSRLGEPDAIIVCVPTPLGRHQEPDLQYVVTAARQIGARLRPGQLVVLESTTYPRTTRDEFLPAMLEACPDGERLRVGEDVFVGYSPEREDPGRASHDTRTIPKLVGGIDPRSAELAALMYRKGIKEVVSVSSCEVAEAAKLLENIFRSVNIALVNEMKMILESMDIDPWEVIRAASTKPFGFMPFYPGPGLGGHCIPIDPFYLTWKAKEYGYSTRFIELAGAINTSMPRYVVERTTLALNDAGKSMRGSRILILGLAYKPDIDDTRESPAFEIIEELRRLGCAIDYSDPYLAETRPVRRHDVRMASVAITPAAIASYDAIIIAADHSDFDYKVIGENAQLIVDTRDAMRRRGACVKGRLVRA